MEPKILPEPPTSPAELEAPISEPTAPTPGVPPAATPEQIASAAEDYAWGTAALLDVGMTRRGWTPTSPDEVERFKAQWARVITKYPALATPSKYPELGLVGLAVGMIFIRMKMENEAIAAAAEERARAEAAQKHG